MIKAIVFDCFGVLTADGWLPFKNKYFSDDEELFDKASKLNRQANAGLISYQDFVTEIAKLAGVSEEKVRYSVEHNLPDEAMFEYIASLKPKYQIGLLSNASGNWLPRIFSEGQINLFDAISLSFETGHIKPYPEAYQDILDKLGVEASAAIMIDDQARHCHGAEEAGLKAVLYEDLPQLKREIEIIINKGKE